MSQYTCNGCYTPLPHIPQDGVVSCPTCSCTNQIVNGQCRVIFGDQISMGSQKKLIRISDDLFPYLDALKVLGFEYTDVINNGIALYINSLPDEVKKKIPQVRALQNRSGE